MSEQITMAIITGAVAIVTTLVPAYLVFAAKTKQLRSDKEAAELQISHQTFELGFVDVLARWDAIQRSLKDLTAETEVDRFLILRAWNGKTNPKWTTAIFQWREGDQTPVQYINFEIDDDYRERLNILRTGAGPMNLTVSELPKSLIRSVYEAEGVTHSKWFHLGDDKIDDSSTAITYCSFATRRGPITPATRVRCQIVANQIQGVMKQQRNVHSLSFRSV